MPLGTSQENIRFFHFFCKKASFSFLLFRFYPLTAYFKMRQLCWRKDSSMLQFVTQYLRMSKKNSNFARKIAKTKTI